MAHYTRSTKSFAVNADTCRLKTIIVYDCCHTINFLYVSLTHETATAMMSVSHTQKLPPHNNTPKDKNQTKNKIANDDNEYEKSCTN